MSGFMAQAGILFVGGDAQGSLGDSLYEAVIYVGGKLSSLGADTKVEDLGEDDVSILKDLVARTGFDHVNLEDVTKVVSAKTLYNFDALKDQKY
jgi:glutamate synthase domain-containing protein 3